MKIRILSLILLAFCLMVPAFAQDKMGKKEPKMAPKMSKTKATKMQKATKTSASGKMKDLGNGVFQDSAGKYRDAKGKFMSKKDAEAKMGKKSGPARDAKGRFVKKAGAKMDKKGGKMAPKMDKKGAKK